MSLRDIPFVWSMICSCLNYPEVLVPLIVRTNPDDEGYEIIAGHRRKADCEWAGVDTVSVMVMQMDDAEATIAMIDSNLQREHIRPSEKAFAYKMKLEAMKQQGKRNDLFREEATLSPVGTKLENPTLELNQLVCSYDDLGKWQLGSQQLEKEQPKVRADEMLARQIGESRNQIARYIRLTNLIPKILDMVDEEKLAFRSAVELSYLSEREKLKLYADTLEEYFPSDFTPKQKVELIQTLVKKWHLNQTQQQSKLNEKKGR